MLRNTVSNSMDHENIKGEVPFDNNEGVEFPDHEKSCPDSPSLTQDELDALEKELEYTHDFASLNAVRQKNFEVLNNILSEYLDSYVLLGYSAENDEVIAHKIMNSRDHRAIISLMEEVSIGSIPQFDSDDED